VDDTAELFRRQFEHGRIIEQIAVEMTDALHPEFAAVAHGLEQLADEAAELRRIAGRLLHNPGENHLGQEADVLGEQAENHPVEEMGDPGGVQAALAHGLSDAGDLLGRGLGDRRAGDARPQLFRIFEHGPQDFQTAWLAQLVEGDFMRHGNRLLEICVNDDPVQIANHEQRRVGQGITVEEQLPVGNAQILVLALVLPAEEVLLPNVGETIAAVLPGDAFLKAEGFADGIGLGRRWVAEQPAQVEEVLLSGGAFL